VLPHRFRDRADAGDQLARRTAELGLDRPVVLGLPRGGVPVAARIAGHLGVPVDVLVARKIGAPGRPELAVGAIAEGGEPLFDAKILRHLRLREADFTDTVATERDELARRVRAYRGERALPALAGRDVVLADDGLATGSTARAALAAVREAAPRRLVLAVPVGPQEVLAEMDGLADDVVAILGPRDFGAVSRFYDVFGQLTDDDVRAYLPPLPDGS
jgi:putative phosphoribosyl transferase